MNPHVSSVYEAESNVCRWARLPGICTRVFAKKNAVYRSFVGFCSLPCRDSADGVIFLGKDAWVIVCWTLQQSVAWSSVEFIPDGAYELWHDNVFYSLLVCLRELKFLLFNVFLGCTSGCLSLTFRYCSLSSTNKPQTKEQKLKRRRHPCP